MTYGKPKRYRVQTLPDATSLVLDQTQRNLVVARETLNHLHFEKYSVFGPKKREQIAHLISLLEDTLELQENVWDIENLPRE